MLADSLAAQREARSRLATLQESARITSLLAMDDAVEGALSTATHMEAAAAAGLADAPVCKQVGAALSICPS